MGKHVGTLSANLREVELSESDTLRYVARRFDFNDLPANSYNFLRRPAKHTTPGDIWTWWRINGEWHPDVEHKLATRPYNPASGYTPAEWDDKYAPEVWYGSDGSSTYYPNGSAW